MNTTALRSRKGSILAWGALALIVLLIVVFGMLGKPPEQKIEEVEKAYPVRVEIVELQTVPDEIPLPGLVMPLKEAELSAEKAGRVVELKVDQGARVNKGELLLRLDGRAWSVRRDAARLVSWKTYVRRYPGYAVLAALGLGMSASAGLARGRWARLLGMWLVRRAGDRAGQHLWQEVQRFWTESTPDGREQPPRGGV